MNLPNYTQVSNQFIDDNLCRCSGAETKVFLAVCRKTIGWHKVSDKISYSQIAKLTGLSVNGLKAAIVGLIEKGFIIQSESGQGYTYDLVMDATVSESDRAVSISDTETVSEIDTTKETSKENIQKKKSLSPIGNIQKRSHKPPRSQEDKNLYTTTKAAFESKYGDFENYAKEGPAIYGIIDKARKLGEPHVIIPAMMDEFHYLSTLGNDYWKSQPFLPSRLNSAGIWAGVRKRIEETRETPEEAKENQAFIDQLFGSAR